jgi:FkbM family methyltransferase
LSLEFCTNRKTAIDIGANVGLWSRDLTAHFAQVIAFEPVPLFRECLSKNVTNANFTVYNQALGNEHTWAKMNVTLGNMGHTHIAPDSIGQGDTEIRTLDSYDFNDISYIKMDCEGFEYRVIQGAEQTIKRCRPVVVVEQKPHDAYSSDYGQYAAIDLLKSWGMVVLQQVKDDWIMGWQ